jgi:hypothetical protein
MSEETKAKVIENENPSVAEKETKVLKKIGADTGDEAVTKVDLRQPLKEKSDAVQEQSTDEVLIRDESESSEEIQEKNIETSNEESADENEEAKEEAIIEEINESEEKQINQPELSNPTNTITETETKTEQPEISIPEGVFELVNFINETGGTVEDYVKLNKDYSKLENKNIIKEYYNTLKPHLNLEEIDFLINDKFNYDEEIDDPLDIKRKQLAYKEEIANAKNYLESQKTKYYKEIKGRAGLSPEQQKAVDFFNRYNKEQQKIVDFQKTAAQNFSNKTNEVFNENFKGFDFSVDNKKFRFKSKNIQADKNAQMDVMKVFGSYLNSDNTLNDGHGYHKALFAARNADNIANHFYQLGKTEAIKELASDAKNINMDPRQTSSGTIESGGVKVRAISGDDSSKLRIKLKK